MIPHARAKIAVRVPPGADPVHSMDAVERHIRAHVPWGAQIEIAVEPASTPIALPAPRAAEQALEQAFGKPVARMGSGGSVPLVAKLRDAYPDAQFVLWGAQDSDLARIHAANESVDISARSPGSRSPRRCCCRNSARADPARPGEITAGRARTNSAVRGVADWNTGSARPGTHQLPAAERAKSFGHHLLTPSRPCADRTIDPSPDSKSIVTSIESPRAKRRTRSSASSVR